MRHAAYLQGKAAAGRAPRLRPALLLLRRQHSLLVRVFETLKHLRRVRSGVNNIHHLWQLMLQKVPLKIFF
jgi:hypothetical protein